MKGKEFYQILKERQTAGATDLTAATILEGAEDSFSYREFKCHLILRESTL